MSKKRNTLSDIQGAGRLSKETVTGIIDIVEAIHYKIISLGGLLGNNKKQRTSGITGLVYRNIRSITNLSGSGLDELLDKLAFAVKEKEPTPEYKALLSGLNGVLGDHLLKKSNPLAIRMQLTCNGKPLGSLDQISGNSIHKIVLLVHGSCMNDLQWDRKGHNHGSALEKDCGYTPVHLLYNSGRHISENGKEFAQILEEFVRKLPEETELIILAHSMGGLVSRSACYYAKYYGHDWPKKLRKLIFLGTPHHGAPLERGGNWIDNILEKNPFSAPISSLGKLRSAGITDLRYGNILDEDWNQQDRFSASGDQRNSVNLPESTACYAIAASIGAASTKLEKELIGDGLVPVNSALGIHKRPHLNLSFPKENQWIGSNMKHLDLLNHRDVYDTIKMWIKS